MNSNNLNEEFFSLQNLLLYSCVVSLSHGYLYFVVLPYLLPVVCFLPGELNCLFCML